MKRKNCNEYLSKDVLSVIVQYLMVYDKIRFAKTCKLYKEIVVGNTKSMTVKYKNEG
jgi:hypothetical protein